MDRRMSHAHRKGYKRTEEPSPRAHVRRQLMMTRRCDCGCYFAVPVDGEETLCPACQEEGADQ